MFCINCGQALPDDANFCSKCGASTNGKQTVNNGHTITQPELEYTYFKIEYSEGGAYYLTHGRSEQSVRDELWNDKRSSIMPRIQKYLMDGWQASSTIGANAFKFYRRTDKQGTPYLSVKSFFVELERSARELTILEKQLIGIWEQLDDPDGFNRFVNNLLQGFAGKTVHYEFFKDKTYRWTNINEEEVNRGVYKDDGKGGILILPKNWEQLADENIRFEQEKMVLVRRYSDRDELREFRFVKKENTTG